MSGETSDEPIDRSTWMYVRFRSPFSRGESPEKRERTGPQPSDTTTAITTTETAIEVLCRYRATGSDRHVGVGGYGNPVHFVQKMFLDPCQIRVGARGLVPFRHVCFMQGLLRNGPEPAQESSDWERDSIFE